MPLRGLIVESKDNSVAGPDLLSSLHVGPMKAFLTLASVAG
jgi:hypothetical protein